MPPVDGLLGGDLLGRLEAWAATARVEDAARRRSQERWLRQMAEEEATLAGVLADLGERNVPIVLRTGADRSHQGVVRVVGEDFAGLRTSTGDVVVAFAAIGVVRHVPGERPVVGDRTIRTGLTIVDVLGALLAERERVLLVTRDGSDAIAGELRSVGQDVVVVRPDVDRRASVYVRLDSIAELMLRP